MRSRLEALRSRLFLVGGHHTELLSFTRMIDMLVLGTGTVLVRNLTDDGFLQLSNTSGSAFDII